MRAAVEELGMNWVQLLDVDASDIYGIHAIPRTFLVDPTGIVIDKNLRGENWRKLYRSCLNNRCFVFIVWVN